MQSQFIVRHKVSVLDSLATPIKQNIDQIKSPVSADKESPDKKRKIHMPAALPHPPVPSVMKHRGMSKVACSTTLSDCFIALACCF